MSVSDWKPTTRFRAAVFLAADVVIWSAGLWTAFLIRFDGRLPDRYLFEIPWLLAVLIPAKLVWQVRYRLYHLTWRSVELGVLIDVVKGNTLGMLTAGAVLLGLRSVEAFSDVPRSVLILDYLLGTCGVAVFRASRRAWHLQRERRTQHRRPGPRLLIYGAGGAGTRIARSILEGVENGYHPVGFIDDDRTKQGAFIQGLRVLGGRESLARVVAEHGVDEVVVAIPSAHPVHLRVIVESIREAGVQRVKILPGVAEWLAGRVRLKDIQEVNPQDLLGRPRPRVQHDALKTYLAGKRVLVTGAAGSIGSEMIRQLSGFGLERLIAADINESGLFELEQRIVADHPDVPLRAAIADVRDRGKIEWLLDAVRPHVVFHAAAYKHVPLMEREVEEAVKTNVFGTLALAEAALRSGVEALVFISTDKAVRPTGVMGASKRVGELVIQALAERGETRFLAVRFGNVLGSRGSIVPMLQDQIRRGGPVAITHPDMMRYFMTIDEAVLLVLQTPLIVTPGHLFMLDMGDPVRIVDLVRELISLSGLEADQDIPIVFSGIRAGEKLQEQLALPDERVVPTVFDRILELRAPRVIDEAALRAALAELKAHVLRMDTEGMRAVLGRLAGLRTHQIPGPAVTAQAG